MNAYYTDGDALSQHLGKNARNGDRDALQMLKEFADNEEPDQAKSRARAIYELGKIHFEGLCGVEKSLKKASELFKKSAELGDPLALIKLGEFYRDGKNGFKQNGKVALEYFLKATDRGKAEEGFKLAAEMYRKGQGGLKADGYKTLEFYEELDALNGEQALINIARLYEEGCGKFRADGYKALEIYDEIIRSGEYWLEVYRKFGMRSSRLVDYEDALQNTARIYLEGKSGVRPDSGKAIEYLEKFAEVSDDEKASTFTTIAEIYLDGKSFAGKGGVEPDGQKSLEYLNRVIEISDNDPLGNKYDAMHAIAKIYRDGIGGVVQDGKKALEYLNTITECESDEDLGFCNRGTVLREMAEIYEEGCGEVEPDIKKALALYRKSAKLDDFFAKKKVKELTRKNKE